MKNRTSKLREIDPNWELWQKLYYQHQQSYIRQKLLAIKYLWLGYSRREVAQQVGCSYVTLTEWIDKFIKGGLLELTKLITHQVSSRLNESQQMELKRMILESRPTDYGIDRAIWTGKIISRVIEQRWGVSLKDSRIYEILDSLKLSHQKAHRDYANVDEESQKEFTATLKKTVSSADR
jgi:transposase